MQCTAYFTGESYDSLVYIYTSTPQGVFILCPLFPVDSPGMGVSPLEVLTPQCTVHQGVSSKWFYENPSKNLESLSLYHKVYVMKKVDKKDIGLQV